jgi:hypothetical protein
LLVRAQLNQGFIAYEIIIALPGVGWGALCH